MPLLAGVKEAKFRTAVYPGDDARIRRHGAARGLRLRRRRMQRWRDGKKVCEARMTYRLIPYPNPQFRQAMTEWAERIGLPAKELEKELDAELGREPARSLLSERTPRGVDHRHRIAHVSWRRARRGLEPSRTGRSAAL